MKPARFDYVRAESIVEAHDVLAAEGGEASVLAGGQSLLPLLSTRLARPKVVLDIMRIPGLDVIARESDAIRVGAALYEEYAYAPDGAFLAGTFADYLLPTATEVPAPLILHTESPSPFTPLGAKGVGEGNCMSTPVCLANAVADALGIAAIDLPMTPSKLAAHIHPPEHARGRS